MGNQGIDFRQKITFVAGVTGTDNDQAFLTTFNEGRQECQEFQVWVTTRLVRVCIPEFVGLFANQEFDYIFKDI